MKKKWSIWDIICVILEVMAPIISTVVVCVQDIKSKLDIDTRLAIVCSGISIPIILIQLSINQGKSEIIRNCSVIYESNKQINEKVEQLSPVLENVFKSDNKELKRFAYRHYVKTCEKIQSAYNNNDSGKLEPNEYYEELLHLADLIIEDKKEKRSGFKGEVWAMTSFAENEWVADDGYEKQWTEKLHEMAEMGIKTRRLCLMSNELDKALKTLNIDKTEQSSIQFMGFIELLDSYYGKDAKRNVTEHFIIKENDNSDLKEIKGFFAIKLTNEDLHILYGETVDAKGALTAKLLFDQKKILEVRHIFDRYAIDSNNVNKRLKKQEYNDFLNYLIEECDIML